MGSRGTLGVKRRRPGSDGKSLTADERPIYDLIKSKETMGIWKGDIRRELNIPNIKQVDNCIKTLLAKKLVKEVPDIQARGKKRLLAVEFEPSTELTGGVWYQDGSFDSGMITDLKKSVKHILVKQKVATADGLLHALKNLGVLLCEFTIEDFKQLLEALILEKEIIKVKSTGLGEFISFPINAECYKLKPKQKNVGALASIPCGVCPRINQCSPNGIISPITCEYYTKWLEF